MVSPRRPARPGRQALHDFGNGGLRHLDPEEVVTTTAGAIANLAARWAVAIGQASDPTRRRKVVERDASGRIVSVIDEVAT